MLRVLAPKFSPAELDTLDELRVGVVPLDDEDALVRARVREAAAHFPHRLELTDDLPLSKFGKVAKNVLTKQLAEKVQA